MTDVSMLEQIKEAQKNKLNQREISWTLKEMPHRTNAIISEEKELKEKNELYIYFLRRKKGK
jgi:hypothetical protein